MWDTVKSIYKGMGEIDIAFFMIIMILLVMGIVMMFSASYAWAIDEGKAGSYYAQKQLMMAGAGLVAMLMLSVIDYHIYANKYIAYGLYGVTVILLILVLLIGDTDKGAQRWIQVGSFQFQPSEIMKLAIIILFSYLISKNYNKMGTFKYGVMPYLALLGIVAVLMMLQPHLSGTLLISMTAVTLLFVGGMKIKHLLELAGIGILGLGSIIAYKIMVEGYSYFGNRIESWKNPFGENASDTTWQTCQSLIAIGSGGLFGLGLGESRQKYLYLPESKNDFVFSIVCEELGFVGAVTVILLFAMFVFRGFYIATKAPDKFGMLMAVGLTVQIGYQALINIAVVSNFVPNTGISLPFFSYGGTALGMQLAQMGILLNISRQSIIQKQ